MATKFPDVPADAWYAKAVEKVNDMGLMLGYEDGTFRPNDKLTRAEAATILKRLIEKMEDDYDV
jgi:hypothetical protein